ncbi:MAG TPA: hypothetical protein V6C89_21020, partial [Drouetiella sp.]
AYRNFVGRPLSKNEQSSIVDLWHTRILKGSPSTIIGTIDEREAYITLRARAIGADPKKNMDLSWSIEQFCWQHQIGDASMSQARKTLTNLLRVYKPGSQQVREWVKAQDGIFGIAPAAASKNQNNDRNKDLKILVPAPLPANADALLQDYRNYQIGAANFYLSNFDMALPKFESIAARANSPLRDVASYMVLRVKSARALLEHKDENNVVEKLLQNAAAHATKTSERESLFNLLRPINYLNLTSAEAVKMLSSKILEGKDQRFGGDVGDLTFLLDGNPLHPDSAPPISTVSGETNSTASPLSEVNPVDLKSDDSSAVKELISASDLADWVITIQSSIFADDSFDDSPEAKARVAARERRNATHALQMWRQTKSLPWLVAALTTNTLRSAGTKDLYDAANAVPASSPAYLTCRFYLADALIVSGKKQEARNLLKPLLAIANMPPSSRNLFTMQMAAASQTVADYLKFAVQQTPEVLQSNSDLVTPKFLKVEASKTFATSIPAFDAQVADDISRNAPLSTWMAFSQSGSLPQQFKAIVLRSAWTRAQLLQRNDQALKLSDALASSNPLLREAVARFKAAPEGPARQFAGACVVLKFFGMTPYLKGGLERHGERVDEFDWYNGNFWVPFPLVKKAKSDDDNWSDYYATVSFNGSTAMSNRLAGYGENGLASRLSAEEKTQATAERALILKNNPSRYYGETVLTWAKSHPSDPDVPEMLYRVVKLPKWTAESAVGSEYSRKAYIALHANYPGSKWAKKAVCYY